MSEEKSDVAQMWDGQEMGSEGKHGRPWRASGPDLDLILKEMEATGEREAVE